MSKRQAELHAIVDLFAGALSRLGRPAPPAKLERWALVIHRAMTGAARVFHTNEHVVSLAAGAGPIETLAALFHDVAYLQVDEGLPADLASKIAPYVTVEPGGATVLAGAADAWAGMVTEVFGVEAGDRLTVFGGANELLSALVAGSEIGSAITEAQLVEVAACIEATIPFRGEDAGGHGPMERLFERLGRLEAKRKVGLGEADRVAAVQRAAWVANHDVESFAEADVGRFLDGTWRLLPEFNPVLRQAEVYTVVQYRTALLKMAGFFASLDPAKVFHRFRGVPDDAAYEGMRARAASNLEVSVRYLGLKLLAIAYIEALALATGGDAPLELFMGGIREGGDRLEQHLPDRMPDELPKPAVLPELWALVDTGRARATSFDLQRAPLAAFLYAHLGEARMAHASLQATRLFKGELDGPGFLATQPAPLVGAVAEAVSHLATTRREALRGLTPPREGAT